MLRSIILNRNAIIIYGNVLENLFGCELRRAYFALNDEPREELQSNAESGNGSAPSIIATKRVRSHLGGGATVAGSKIVGTVVVCSTYGMKG